MNLRGEMQVAIKQEISLLDFSLIEKMAESMRLTSAEVHRTQNSELRNCLFNP